ncbi:MAG: orotate phosphoribosyltransferase [Deltaproteobacteria bacterium]|nr:MAG: orotate phosphoribosyltransferase [Deltaproteobacteria bacterium]
MSKREVLKRLLVEDAVELKEVILSSGKRSNYYIDGRMVSTTPEGAPVIADIIKEMIGDVVIDAVGGPTIGADPILGALAGKGYYRTFIIRKEPKEHGLGKWIEGQLTEEDKRVVIIDDVATTGGSIIKAIKTLKSEFPQIDVVKVIVLVDREEGASERLREEGYKVESIFKAKELVEAKKEKLARESKCQAVA